MTVTEKKKAPGTGPVKLRNINVTISDQERAERALQAAKLSYDINRLLEHKKAFNQKISIEIKEKRAEVDALVFAAEVRREDRMIECYEEKDLDKEILFIKRADTHEVIDSRRLKPAEMQADLPMEDPETMRSTKAPASPALGGASKAKPPKAANVPPPVPMGDLKAH